MDTSHTCCSNHSTIIKQIFPYFSHSFSLYNCTPALLYLKYYTDFFQWTCEIHRLTVSQGKQKLGLLTDIREYMQWYIYQSWCKSYCCEWKYSLCKNKELQKLCNKVSIELAELDKNKRCPSPPCQLACWNLCFRLGRRGWLFLKLLLFSLSLFFKRKILRTIKRSPRNRPFKLPLHHWLLKLLNISYVC